MTTHDGRTSPPKPLCILTTPSPSSILSLACDELHLFAGTAPDIDVWEISTFELKKKLRGHAGGVLCLEIAKEKSWLFSCSSDNSVRVCAPLMLCVDPVQATHRSGAPKRFRRSTSSTRPALAISSPSHGYPTCTRSIWALKMPPSPCASASNC